MQEWYLMSSSTRPNITGGFENETFNDWKDDAFYESLETDLADTVILYNYDLSESKEIRCIIQGNAADIQLKSMERAILVPIGTLHSGNYIFFEDEYWIVDGRPGNNKIYEKATVKECQYKLRWQKNDGTIVERYANLTSASKYDVGELKNNTIVLTSNNFTIVIPNDADSMTVDGKRVFIDASEIPEKVFKITRNDDVLFAHGSHGGTLSLIADKDELNKTTDNQELRICNYIDTSTPTTPPSSEDTDESAILRAVIYFSGSQEFKIGGNAKTLTGSFVDADGNTTEDIGTWEIITVDELLPYVKYVIDGNTIKINILETELTDSKVRIMFSNEDNTASTYLDFDVVNMF